MAEMKSSRVAHIPKKKIVLSGSQKKTIQLTVMALPGAIYFILLRYLPMAGLLMAFENYVITAKGFWSSLMSSKWVGFDNFKFLFSTNDMLIAVRNTLLYNITWIFLTLVVSVGFAIMLNEISNKRMAKLYQTLMFFPHFLSWVVITMFVFVFLSHEKGIFNQIIILLGGERIMWYGEQKYWPFILTFAHIWKGAGYNSIIYLAAICGIDHSLNEAAMIDGASRWQRIVNITIPMLTPMMVILTIMAVGKIFAADFGLFYNVPMANMSGALKPVVDVVDTYIYTSMVNMNDFGMSTAAVLSQSFVGLIMISLANFTVRCIDEELSLF